jgi:methylmalonyl-CoA/ethylmalonyl-CoA epimerase
VAPVAAVAFGGRHISFVMFRNGLMLEFIENVI